MQRDEADQATSDLFTFKFIKIRNSVDGFRSYTKKM